VNLRAVAWAGVLCGCAVAAVLTALTIAVPAAFPVGVWLALAGVGGAGAYILDDPTAAVSDATPATVRRRALGRAPALIAPLAVWLLCVLAVDARYDRLPALIALGAGAACTAAGFAAAALLRHFGWNEPGEAVAFGFGALMLGGAIFQPAIHGVTPYDPRPAAMLWWIAVTAVATGALWFGTRDALT
jgi:hypothetical protein